MKSPSFIYRFAEKIKEKGGRAYFVGGYVRDAYLGRKPHDMDVEVYGVAIPTLEELLSAFGKVETVGKSFGIYLLEGVDIAVPRTEEKIGNKHTDFRVEADPFLLPERAVLRRDFTMNALLQDILSGEIIDVCHGRKDIDRRLIRHIDEVRFAEDPLRVYRAARFASQLDFSIAAETIRLAKTMDVGTLAKERIEEEIKKGMNGFSPAKFLKALQEMGKLPAVLQGLSFSFLDTYRFVSREKTYLSLCSYLAEKLPKGERVAFWQTYFSKKEDVHDMQKLADYHLLTNRNRADTYFLYHDLRCPRDYEEYLMKRGSALLSFAEYTQLKRELRIDGSYLLRMGFHPAPGFASLLKELQRIEIMQGYEEAAKKAEEYGAQVGKS